jgi:long-subunit fatty acid transport protein
MVFGVKVGAMYKPLPWLTVGATYTSPVSFGYTDGASTLNLSAFGLGTVNYDARVEGFDGATGRRVDGGKANRQTPLP